jgi:hypothetical protein
MEAFRAAACDCHLYRQSVTPTPLQVVDHRPGQQDRERRQNDQHDDHRHHPIMRNSQRMFPTKTAMYQMSHQSCVI